MPAKRFIVPFYSVADSGFMAYNDNTNLMLPEAEFSISFETRAAYSRLINICSFADINGTCIIRRFKTTDYDVTDPRIPEAFDGFKIAHISDLHCEWFGEGAKFNAVRAGEPDIIV